MSDSDFEVVDSVQTLQMEVGSLQQQLDAAGAAAVTATVRHKEELDKEKTAHATTKASLATLQAAFEKIQQELAVKDRAYNETVAAKDSFVADLRSQIWQAGVQAASQRTQLQAKTTEAADGKSAHAATKASLDTLQAAHNKLKAELLATKASLTKSTAQLNTCRAWLQAKTTEAVEDKAAHEAIKASLVTLKAELLATKASLTKSTAQLQAKATEAAKEKAKASLVTFQAANEVLKALLPDKDLLCEVLAFIRGKKITSEAITRAKIICTKKMEVEKNMTAMGIYSVGCHLCADETVTINGTLYTDKDCFLKALEIDPRHASSYNFLASRMVDEKTTVTINGTPYTKKDCSIKALEIDPTNKWAWTLLGEMIKKTEETVRVSGVYYTKEECLTNGQ